MSDQAWQTFYGTIPLILVLVAIYFNQYLLLKDILARLGKLETLVHGVDKRLIALENRAGIIYQPTGD